MTLEEYAKDILYSHGCDEYTYGGEWSKHVLDDLKEAYPDGMEFPYVDVANAILSMSRPKPIVREPWLVHWWTDDCDDGFGCTSFDEAKECSFAVLVNWIDSEYEEYAEDPESINYMIYNCGAEVMKYNPMTDEYEEYWYPSHEELKEIGWELREEE